MHYTFRTNGGDPHDISFEGEYAGKKWWDVLSSTNWKDASIRENFQNMLDKSSIKQYQYCDALENDGVVGIILEEIFSNVDRDRLRPRHSPRAINFRGAPI